MTKEYCVQCDKVTTFINPFNDSEYMCRSCVYDTSITATDAKDRYKLSDQILSNLSAWTYSSRYHARIRRFLLEEVKQQAKQLYGVDTPSEIETMKQNERLISSMMKHYPEDFEAYWAAAGRSDITHGKSTAFLRYKKMKKDFPTIFEEDHQDKEQFGTYMKNYILKRDNEGLGMIKCIRKWSQPSPSFESLRSNIYTKDMIQEYFSDKNFNPDTLFAELAHIWQRKTELELALHKKGLELRSDSALCTNYIKERSEYHSLEKTVSIMENMRFLFQHTDYKSINSYMLDYAFETRYDYDDYVDKHAISQRAQAKAVRAFVKKGGDVSLIPDGLRKHVSA